MAPAPPTDCLKLTLAGNTATITLCQPTKLNALNGADYLTLANTLRHIATLPDITITLLTGTGRYFSAGADISSFSHEPEPTDPHAKRQFWFSRFGANNTDVTAAFLSHPKILIAALNGPAVGLSAALVAFADFVYITPATFLLTPFSSLGLVSEGGSSAMFVRRMGVSKANEALILSKRITADELVACGFANKVFGEERFHEEVATYVRENFGAHLNQGSMLQIKGLVKKSWEQEVEKAGVNEILGGVQRFVEGWPQREFAALKSGSKRHKL